MKRHTPTPQEILDAVCHAFRAEQEDVLGTSRKREYVEPREVYIALLSIRGALEYPEIMKLTGCAKPHVYKCIKMVRGWVRSTDDFAFKVWEAEKMILGIKEKHIITHS